MDKKLERIARYVLLGGFFAILLLPLIGTPFQWGLGLSSGEKRKLANFPSCDVLCEQGLNAWRGQFETFINDHFGFRTDLITSHNALLYLVFSVSGTPRVIAGKEGWFFYAQAFDDLLHQKPHPDKWIKRYGAIFQRRYHWLAKRKTGYAVVLAPNKTSIYPQHLRGWPEQASIGPRNMLSIQTLLEDLGIPTANIFKSFVETTEPMRLYHKTDTHWNDLGAFVAYQATCEAMGLKPMARKLVSLSRGEGKAGDLIQMLNLHFLIREDLVLVNCPGGHRPRPTGEKIARFDKIKVFENPDADEGTLIIFGDSFAHGTKYGLFLATHFKRTIVIRDKMGTFDRSLIERENPRFVIQESVERYLGNPWNIPGDGL